MSQFSKEFVDADGVIVGIRSRFSPRMRLTVPVSEKASRTRQADAKAADINFIVSRYKQTVEIPVAQRAVMFSDMASTDYKEAMDMFTSAQQSFMQLPAKVRSVFQNDPSNLLAALDKADDPKVREYLEASGVLLKASPEPDVKSGDASKKSSATPVAKSPKATPEPVKGSGEEAD